MAAAPESDLLQQTRRDLTIQIGPHDFVVQSIPFMRESLYISKKVLATGNSRNSEDGSLVVIPIFMSRICPPEVVQVVTNFCYEQMAEIEITSSNVVRVMITSEVLQMENLKRRALKFFDDVSWESCLDVLATFTTDVLDEEDPNYVLDGEVTGVNDEHEELRQAFSTWNILFDKCRKALIKKIHMTFSAGCNFSCFSRVGWVLPFRIANIVYEDILREKLAIYYKDHVQFRLCWQDSFARSGTVACVCLHQGNARTASSLKCACWDEAIASSVSCEYRHDRVRRVITAITRCETITIVYLVRLIRVLAQKTFVLLDFLCALLEEATKREEAATVRVTSEVCSSESKDVEELTCLREELTYLHKFAGDIFRTTTFDTSPQFSSRQEKMQMFVDKFSFSTILSIVKNLSITSDFEMESFDACMLARFKANSFTEDQVLEIYKEFPNHNRPCHDGLFAVFEEILGIETLCSSQVSLPVDFKTLSNELIDRLWTRLGPRMEDLGVNNLILHGLLDKRTLDSVELGHSRDALESAETELKRVKMEVKSVETKKRKLELELEAMKAAKRNVEHQLDQAKTDRYQDIRNVRRHYSDIFLH